jgi:zinc D-Ala-D-Ala carboxypeptidase
MQLSKNFSLAELTKSQTAERMGMDNNPNEDETENLRILCERVLQPVRDHFNHVVTISSGYRNEILSAKIGSSRTSQHCAGEAADFEIFGIGNNEVADWIKENLMFDQLILEFWTPGQANSGWVHVSYKKEINSNRKEYLMAIKNPETGKVDYKPILGLSTDRYAK